MPALPSRLILSFACVAVAACGGGGGSEGAELVVRDSAGIAIVEHPAAAVDAVPLVRLAEPELSIGGEEADEDHDATFLGRAILVSDGIVAYNSRESRFGKFDGTGQRIASHGRRGQGPDEYQFLMTLRTAGDSMALVEVARSTWRILRPDLTVTPTTAFGEGPAFEYQPFGFGPGAELYAVHRQMGPSTTETSGPPRRESRAIVRKLSGAATWDTVLMFRGELSHPFLFREGEHSAPGLRMVTFGDYPYYATRGDQLVLVDNADWGIAIHDGAGTLRRLVRFDLPRRPMTQAIRDSVFARDIRQLESSPNLPEALKAQWLEMSKSQVFADSIAPYDRILVGRDGRLWLRLNETQVDTTTTWHGHDGDGRLVARLLLPRGWGLLDTDGDRVLVRRTDELDIGYLEIRRMIVPGREGDGGAALPES